MSQQLILDRVNREHPEYRDRAELWQRYWDFYVGGEQLRRNASRYLVRRQKEPNDVYAERVARAFYENYLGSCIDWYAATLFRSPPRVTFSTGAPGNKDFYHAFLEDSDLKGSALPEIVRRVFIQSLVFKKSYLLVDFPQADTEFNNRAAEDAAGKSRAYVALFAPRDLINWCVDDRGQFEWVVLRTERVFQEELESPGLIKERRWSYYDRESFQVYAHRTHEAGPQGEISREADARLIAQGRHGLAELGQVPLLKMELSEGLWLANKAGLLQLEHFNKSNALSWALHMGLFAMPVIYSEREWQQIVGEAYYIQLGSNDRFGWTEPEGKVFQIAADNLDRLKDEIYRVCYLMTQAGGREARHLGQSGESKRRDFAVTHEILRGYGSIVKEFIRRLLHTVRDARRDEVAIEVGGMHQFEAPDLSEELENALELRELEIPSARFAQEVQQRVALKYLEGASQEAKDQVVQEIQANAV